MLGLGVRGGVVGLEGGVLWGGGGRGHYVGSNQLVKSMKAKGCELESISVPHYHTPDVCSARLFYYLLYMCPTLTKGGLSR